MTEVTWHAAEDVKGNKIFRLEAKTGICPQKENLLQVVGSVSNKVNIKTPNPFCVIAVLMYLNSNTSVIFALALVHRLSPPKWGLSRFLRAELFWIGSHSRVLFQAVGRQEERRGQGPSASLSDSSSVVGRAGERLLRTFP